MKGVGSAMGDCLRDNLLALHGIGAGLTLLAALTPLRLLNLFIGKLLFFC